MHYVASKPIVLSSLIISFDKKSIPELHDSNMLEVTSSNKTLRTSINFEKLNHKAIKDFYIPNYFCNMCG